MSFGDHLEELRGAVLRSLLGVVLGTILSLAFGRLLIEAVCRPLLIAQQANGLQPSLQVLAPAGAFLAYVKIGLLTGLLLSMPWVLYQIWLFVATGLYPHESRFVRRLIPTSLGLFALGVAFLYFIVLPIVLHFFIRFNQRFEAPSLDPTGLQKLLFDRPDDTPEFPGDAPTSAFPMLPGNPKDVANGTAWINTRSHRLMVQTPDGLWSVPLERGVSSPTMRSMFALDQYISFVLLLALAFGIAFETPIVVFFLAWSGIVPTATMARGRRYVLLAAVVMAAILTPPDVISQLLLAGPIYLLFELGIFVARMTERNAATND